MTRRRNELRAAQEKVREQSSSASVLEDEEFVRDYEKTLDEYQSLRRDYEELERQRDALQLALRQVSTASAVESVGESSVDKEPETVREAVEIAESTCDCLVFLDEAVASAAESRYGNPRQVLDDLRALNRLATAWAEGFTRGGFSTSRATVWH